MRHCPRCDQANPAEAQFCSRCGASLAPATTGDTLPVTAPPIVPAPTASAPVVPTLDAPVTAPATPIAPPAAPVPAAAPVHVNVTVAAAPAVPSPVVVLAQQPAGPGCLVRGLYFLFVGLWLGFLWTIVAWGLLVTVIGLPLGLLMLNRLPQVMTLKPVRTQTQVTLQGGAVVVGQGALAQQPFWLRALYFLLVGWWLSGLWLGLAWGLVGVSFGLGLPLAFWMFDRTPAIVTLARQ
ncbi:MAG TPA: zinc ribbon domain-containing protein [Roseiflexaceae bacterium]|nr:zinc ribbon domain-containing protein [Roseiflexaceae bacterium]